MNTILDEKETQSVAVATPNKAAVAQQKTEARPAAPAIVPKAKTESYPSCLDLAAEFIARG